ncbi:MAG: fructose-specific PTS transporter subunit EIIC [Bacilli bacterium]|nr:fructose-specific PTS transporter subunit EIIC [Bacilli bacterium]
MKITDLLTEKTISIKTNAVSKEDVIKQAVALIAKSGAINDVDTYEKGVFKREEESTTGIGEGIAIPHCKSDVVSKPALAAMVIPEGVDYASLDGEKVNLLFLIAAPNSEDNVHLDVLARLSEMLMDEEFKNRLLAAKSEKEFLKVIDEAEAGKLEETEETVQFPRILAVTGCPTGIAHTYMAEQALKDKAKEMGLTIKVETNGSGGIKNALTDEEIEHCDGIVVAADVNVELDRFAGKRVVQAPVAKGIHEPENLINKALDPETPIFKPGETRKASGSGEKLSVGRTIYKHLMSGVSHMLPFVIGGGILIAIAFLIATIKGDPTDSTFGTLGVAGWFKNIGGFAFSFMVWILAGFIAHSIAGRPGLAVGMVGGFIATIDNFNIECTINNNTPSGSTAGFLGGIVAGFAAGYLVLGLMRLFKFLPKSLESLKPTLIIPVLGILIIGGFMYLVNTPLIYVNRGFTNLLNGLNDLKLTWLLCMILAGMMAIDMGGPINKAAYVFATAALSTATTSNPTGYIIMAAVMAGGMVPPIGIALSAHLFPAKYTKSQRREAYVNYIMGGAFITEGAIPFAAADPWRVIVSCIGGSMVSGLLTGLFQCGLYAPHGGVFVIATIQPSWSIPLYLLAIVAGSFVTAVLLGSLKKDVEDPELGKWKGIRLPWNKNKAK